MSTVQRLERVRTPRWEHLVLLAPGVLMYVLSIVPRTTEVHALFVTLVAIAGFLFSVGGALIMYGNAVVAFDLKLVHAVQTCMHLSIYVYWGIYWREVPRFFPLLIAQVVFAYGIDGFLKLFQGKQWVISLAPLPVVLSTNLFLWFKDEVFWCQFLMIAACILSKEVLVWRRDGVVRHIFNPSAFGLCIASMALLINRDANLSWGLSIANTLAWPPNMYVEIFALGLVVQALFAVTAITIASLATLVVVGASFHAMTGHLLFGDSSIPVLVFLGCHFFVTDPATSPKTTSGRLVFGVMYAAGIIGAYTCLKGLALPTFYDKLLCVPLLNLAVRRIDCAFRTWSPLLKLECRYAPIIFQNRWLVASWSAMFGILTMTGYIPSSVVRYIR